MNATWCDSARTIAGFATLADDWDGLGAIAPTPVLIIKAMSLLIELNAGSTLPPPSRVGACPMGGILFEWQESGRYLEVEVAQTGEIAWMEERDGQPTRHGIGTLDGAIEWKKNR